MALLDQLPDVAAPEIAFAGRSNVGKSSLINGVTGRRALARPSGEPGRTKELIFFDVAGRLRLVDMPGYGYAKASRTDAERWQALMRDYLRGRPGLARVFVLVDARHGLKPVDLGILDGLDRSAVVYQIVLTKADKLSRTDLEAIVAATADAVRRRPAAHPRVLAVSAHEGAGLAWLRAEIAALADPPP